MLNMTENLCLRCHRHIILNTTEQEPLHAVRDMFNDLVIIYEKMSWVQSTELKRSLSEAVPRLISVLIMAECLQGRDCCQEQSSYIFTGGMTCSGTSVESQARPYSADEFVR